MLFLFLRCKEDSFAIDLANKILELQHEHPYLEPILKTVYVRYGSRIPQPANSNPFIEELLRNRVAAKFKQNKAALEIRSLCDISVCEYQDILHETPKVKFLSPGNQVAENWNQFSSKNNFFNFTDPEKFSNLNINDSIDLDALKEKKRDKKPDLLNLTKDKDLLNLV